LTISKPAKDQNGVTIPHDHAEIEGNERLIRRISDQWIVPSKNGGKRLSSAALEPSSVEQDPYCGLSIDLEALILADNKDPKAHVTNPAQPGSIAFAARNFRDRHFLVGYDPTPANDYHGQVWQDVSPGARFTTGVKRALLREAVWYVEIPGVKVSDD
jgi:hypothetical protein